LKTEHIQQNEEELPILEIWWNHSQHLPSAAIMNNTLCCTSTENLQDARHSIFYLFANKVNLKTESENSLASMYLQMASMAHHLSMQLSHFT